MITLSNGQRHRAGGRSLMSAQRYLQYSASLVFKYLIMFFAFIVSRLFIKLFNTPIPLWFAVTKLK